MILTRPESHQYPKSTDATEWNLSFEFTRFNPRTGLRWTSRGVVGCQDCEHALRGGKTTQFVHPAVGTTRGVFRDRSRPPDHVGRVHAALSQREESLLGTAARLEAMRIATG